MKEKSKEVATEPPDLPDNRIYSPQGCKKLIFSKINIKQPCKKEDETSYADLKAKDIPIVKIYG